MGLGGGRCSMRDILVCLVGLFVNSIMEKLNERWMLNSILGWIRTKGQIQDCEISD